MIRPRARFSENKTCAILARVFPADPVEASDGSVNNRRQQEGTLYSVQCTVYTLQCTVYTVYCTLLTLHCKLYTVHCRNLAQI